MVFPHLRRPLLRSHRLLLLLSAVLALPAPPGPRRRRASARCGLQPQPLLSPAQRAPAPGLCTPIDNWLAAESPATRGCTALCRALEGGDQCTRRQADWLAGCGRTFDGIRDGMLGAQLTRQALQARRSGVLWGDVAGVTQALRLRCAPSRLSFSLYTRATSTWAPCKSVLEPQRDTSPSSATKFLYGWYAGRQNNYSSCTEAVQAIRGGCRKPQ